MSSDISDSNQRTSLLWLDDVMQCHVKSNSALFRIKWVTYTFYCNSR